MYIALISAHALGLSGMHFFTCVKVQWNGKTCLRVFMLERADIMHRLCSQPRAATDPFLLLRSVSMKQKTKLSQLVLPQIGRDRIRYKPSVSSPVSSECSDFSPGVSVLLLIFLCLEAILFLTFTAVMFGTQIHSICNDETVSTRHMSFFVPLRKTTEKPP